MSHSDPNGILSHVSIGVNDFDQSIHFYDQVLPTLGIKKIMDDPGAVAYGKQYPELWIQTPIDGQPATVGNGTHLGLVAASKDEVDRFHAAAIQAGAANEGEPGPREEYGPAYYGGFVKDPDGHKIEACYWDLNLIQKLYLDKDGPTEKT